MAKVGVVGQGFVGGTMTKCFREKGMQVHTYDKYNADRSTTNSIEELVSVADIIFVCVPTPMRMSDGSCDTSIVEEVVGEIQEAARRYDASRKIAVIRSTVPPGTTEKIQRDNGGIDVMFNPEFLREAHAEHDFINQTRIVLGGDVGKELLLKSKGPMTQVSVMYRKMFPGVPILNVNRTTAEMVKYMTNVFLATKVSLANEFKEICDAFNIDYDKAIQIAQYDERLGRSHWKVPGPDGKFGYGGHCLSKDINALMHVAKQKDVKPTVMMGSWEKNLQVRPPEDRDWEGMENRAVIYDDVNGSEQEEK